MPKVFDIMALRLKGRIPCAQQRRSDREAPKTLSAETVIPVEGREGFFSADLDFLADVSRRGPAREAPLAK
jgi:hypothetical protein